jgi:hypothetical protein
MNKSSFLDLDVELSSEITKFKYCFKKGIMRKISCFFQVTAVQLDTGFVVKLG